MSEPVGGCFGLAEEAGDLDLNPTSCFSSLCDIELVTSFLCPCFFTCETRVD